MKDAKELRTCDRKKYPHVSSMISTVRNQHLSGITGILRYWWKKQEEKENCEVW